MVPSIGQYGQVVRNKEGEDYFTFIFSLMAHLRLLHYYT